MQNRYTGDIGDHSKLGLLRTLQSAGFSIGLNWYLTPDETHNGDGRHVNYPNQAEHRKCDPDLCLGLKAIVDGENREARYMESDDILQARSSLTILIFSMMLGAESASANRRLRESHFVVLGSKGLSPSWRGKTSCALTLTMV